MNIALTFTVAPFGLEPLSAFVLSPIEHTDGLFALVGSGTTDTGVEDPRLFLLDAAVHLPSYAPELSDVQAASIGLDSAADAMLLVVANAGSGSGDSGSGSGSGSGMTVNLLAPVVVNARTGVGAQFILDGQDLPLRAELVRG
ncbi:flagellar assembly protein FliW [Curtobacterium sp. VKM Ac-1395]|uniref:flagellar assembly protein FliW n=1 Tax=Curtobacterium sp. VKM Ac-1395 TaxID=2783815 RepID=UPI00188C7933|nr:flagellar assembly protein FliW [Curtobacterium sp. VKM Ac-1395]MBF4590307.1 flagellar assembly protein FliW [Curtobacterium sp. VKM Ac-1395]